MDKKTWSVETVTINGPEDLREITRGSDVEVTQVKPGELRGSIRHIGIGNLGISMGRFSTEIRSRGPLHRELGKERSTCDRSRETNSIEGTFRQLAVFATTLFLALPA